MLNEKETKMFEVPTLLNDAEKIVGALTVIAGAVAAAWKFVYTPFKTWRAKRTDHYANIEKVLKELLPNGGSSLRDAVNRIEVRLISESESRRQNMNALGLAFWEADADGSTVFASEHLAKLVGLPRERVLGNGWITNLCDEDRNRVVQAYLQSIEQQRMFIDDYTFEHGDGKLVHVHAESQPIYSGGRIIGWVGVLREKVPL